MKPIALIQQNLLYKMKQFARIQENLHPLFNNLFSSLQNISTNKKFQFLKKAWYVFIKEYQSFLGSNLPAFSIALMAFLCGFISVVLTFHADLNYKILRELMFHAFYVIMLIIPTFLAMSAFVIEKKQGTMELLYTLPVQEVSLVLGKFLMGFFFSLFISVSVVLVYLIFIAHTPWYIAISGVLGLILVACYSYSVSLFASSISNSYLVALLIAASILATVDIGGFLAGLLPDLPKTIFRHFHGYYQFLPFTKGVITFRSLIFFMSLTFFFLFTTVKVLESRRWRT